MRVAVAAILYDLVGAAGSLVFGVVSPTLRLAGSLVFEVV